jgi:cation diffusion facilitator family transporter
MAQGLADSSGAALLVIGERRSRRPPDSRHPFGYGREAFFWGLLSAVAMLVIGAGLSAWRGYQQLVNPEPLAAPWLAMAIVAVAILTNGYSAHLSGRKLRAEHGAIVDAFRAMDQPLVKSALLRNAIGTFASIAGLIALLLYHAFDYVLFDALGALVAALMMTAASLTLMAQARALITGRSLPKAVIRRLRRTVLDTAGVSGVNHIAAVYAGTSEILVDADLDLAEDLDTGQIEALLDLVEFRIRDDLPDVEHVRIMLDSPP